VTLLSLRVTHILGKKAQGSGRQRAAKRPLFGRHNHCFASEQRSGKIPARWAVVSGSESIGERKMDISTSRADGVATLRIAGELDAVTVTGIRPSVDALVAERQSRIVVDLSGLRLIDSTGVGRLICLYKKAKEYGGVVTVHGLRDQPAAIFKLLRLDRVLQA
jgi:anti-sigma B factor antagonist